MFYREALEIIGLMFAGICAAALLAFAMLL